MMLQNSIFLVNEEPYCLWEVDIADRNKEFLDGLDARYFEYLLELYTESDDEKRAAIALRATFHHALETLFSLMGAYVQAPDCAYAWIGKCSNKDLRELVKKTNSYEKRLYTKWNIDRVTWETIAEAVFQRYEPGTENNRETAKRFASLWRGLANEFLDPHHIQEYNSIKHGLRIQAGGFALSAGVEHEYGVAPPEDEMRVIGASEHGSTFFKLEPIGREKGSRGVRSKRVSLNWRIEKVALLLQLTSMSINNVISALKIANGAKAGESLFQRPINDADFDEPWKYVPMVNNFSMDFVISDDDVIPATRKQLLDRVGRDGS